MRKHNRKFATRFGSGAVSPQVPQLAHKIVHSKDFQFAANGLLQSMMRKVGLLPKAAA